MKKTIFICLACIVFLTAIVKNSYSAVISDDGGGSGVNNTVQIQYNEIISIILSWIGGISNNLNQNTNQLDQINPSLAPIPDSSSVPIVSITKPIPHGPEINQSFMALKDLYKYVGEKVKVPPCVLEAISLNEYSTVFTYTPEQIKKYSKRGETIPNCPWKECSDKGHMQITVGVDDRGDTNCSRCAAGYCPNSWSDKKQGQAVLKYEGGNNLPEPCNLLDSTYAAAQKLKNDSNTAESNINWSRETILEVGYRYSGNKIRYPHLGNRTYGEYLAHRCEL